MSKAAWSLFDLCPEKAGSVALDSCSKSLSCNRQQQAVGTGPSDAWDRPALGTGPSNARDRPALGTGPSKCLGQTPIVPPAAPSAQQEFARRPRTRLRSTTPEHKAKCKPLNLGHCNRCHWIKHRDKYQAIAPCVRENQTIMPNLVWGVTIMPRQRHEGA